MKLTLGELVSFSLWFLLSEAYHNLCGNSRTEPNEIEVRFSLPNWVGIAEAAVARSSYEQVDRVACHMFLGDRTVWFRTPSPTREEWKTAVRSALSELNISDDTEIDTGGFQSTIQRTIDLGQTISFRFVAESSAAGLTGLREVEADVVGRRYLRKILVVDVGAGSTDIGYVLRTIPNIGANEALVQFPPADTCQVTGKALTDSIVEIYRASGQKIGSTRQKEEKRLGKIRIGFHILRSVNGVAALRNMSNDTFLTSLTNGGCLPNLVFKCS